jgi:hypothetical protein
VVARVWQGAKTILAKGKGCKGWERKGLDRRADLERPEYRVLLPRYRMHGALVIGLSGFRSDVPFDFVKIAQRAQYAGQKSMKRTTDCYKLNH